MNGRPEQGQSVDLLANSVQAGDATGNHTFDLVRLLQEQSGRVQVLCNYPAGRLPAGVRPLVRQIHPADYIPAADLTILQYPVWFPLAEAFRHAPGTALFWYHGVTPPALWSTRTEQDVLRRSIAGTDLAWHAHLAVTDSPFTAQELHAHSGYPLDRIRSVPIGVDTTAFRRPTPGPVLEELRARWKLQGKRVLLYTGRLAGNKRVDLLIDAMSHLARAYPDLHLLVVGDHSSMVAYRELATRLQAQVRDLSLGGRVTFTGRVEAIVPFYHLADVYVSASQHEGFGVPLVEAMAAGLPVVVSAAGALPWVLDADPDSGQGAGLTFVPGDAGGLARQLARVLDDPGLCRSLVDRGRQRAEYFSQEQFRSRVHGLLAEAAELAAQGGPPAAHRQVHPLYAQADVALREYRVRSRIPLLGRLIEWIRHNSTTHVKEAYLDRIVEQQVIYNRQLLDEVGRLQAQVERLQKQLAALQERQGGGPPGSPER